jgi:hypothetical protein
MLKSVILFLISIISISNFFSKTANANEQVLATMSNDENKNTYLLIVDSDEDNQTIKTLYKDVYMSGKRTSRETLDYKQLNSPGLVLEKRDKYVVLKLKSSNFDNEQGGIITIDTLYNGAKGTRKSYDVQMAKTQSNWALINRGKIFKKVFIQSNKVVFLGSVGIKDLVMQ